MTPASWEYLDSVVAAIRYVAPQSAVIMIADQSLAYAFDDKKSQKRLFKHADLDWWHSDFIYVMPSKGDLAEWRGDADDTYGVQADELILHLAAELNGFVISRDRFSESMYQEKLDRIQHRTYSPQIEDDGQGGAVWRFVWRPDLEGRSWTQRSRSLGELRQLDYDLAAVPTLHAEQISSMRREVFGPGGLTERFWREYGRRFGLPETTPSPSRRLSRRRPLVYEPTTALTQHPFKGIVRYVVGAVTGGRDTPSNVGIERRFIFACDRHELQDAVDAHVTVLGRISDQAGPARLGWYGTADGIALSRLPESGSVDGKRFVQVDGRIRNGPRGLELEVTMDSAVVHVEFEHVVRLLADDVTKWEPRHMRRWCLPRLPRRSDRTFSVSRTAVPRPVQPFDPRRPKVAPPGRARGASANTPMDHLPQAPPLLPPAVSRVSAPRRRRPRVIMLVSVGLVLAAAAAAALVLSSRMPSYSGYVPSVGVSRYEAEMGHPAPSAIGQGARL